MPLTFDEQLEIAERNLRRTEPSRTKYPGSNVACFRLRHSCSFVLGRSRQECVSYAKQYHPNTWRLFRHEHWDGGLWAGKWVESKD